MSSRVSKSSNRATDILRDIGDSCSHGANNYATLAFRPFLTPDKSSNLQIPKSSVPPCLPWCTIGPGMPTTFHLKRPPTVPLEAEVLSPDIVGELSNSEIRELTVYHGKRQLPLGEFFDVEGERSTDL